MQPRIHARRRSALCGWVCLFSGVVTVQVARAQDTQPPATVEMEGEVPDQPSEAPVAEPPPASPEPSQALPREEAAESPSEAPQPAQEVPAQAAQEVVETAPVEQSTERAVQGIVGRVVDAQTGEGMIEAQVSVVDSNKRTITDIDGNFVLELPPGTYALRSFYELYEPQRIDNIQVSRGSAASVEIQLKPQGDAIVQEEVVVVTARADRATDETQLQIRRESAAVRDAVSAQEISRSGATNAADAIRRVVSATVDSQNRLIVRGLGSRYTRTLLHGFRLPSTDPDDPGVELDLFPAGVLSNLAVLKTSTPDTPADFAGGILAVETRDFPKSFYLQTNLSLGYNSQATFRSLPTYEGGSRDFLGFDDGTRALPGAIPGDRVSSRREPGVPQRYTADDVEAFGKSFNNNWNVYEKRGLPNMGLGIIVGDTLRVAKRNLGYLAAFGYQYRTTHRDARHQRAQFRTLPDGSQGLDLNEVTRFRDDGASRIGSFGALGTVNYEISQRSSVALTSLLSQSGSADANFAEGEAADRTFYTQRRLRFVERQLWFSQLRGQHRELPKLHDLSVDWNVSAARALRDEPDTRTVRYEAQAPNLPYQWRNNNRSPQRLFSGLEEWTLGTALDLTLPIVDALKLKVGQQTRHSFADFGLRRFSFAPLPGANASEYGTRLPSELFAPENVGTLISFQENTLATDGYKAKSATYAGYGMLELTPVARLRVIGGARFESYQQQLDAHAPTASPQEVPKVNNTTNSVLPSGTLIVELKKDMFLRASYGKTVARPLFRELAPFLFDDDIRRITVSGNPNLVQTQIHNADVRWEMFPSASEVIALTGFYKKFISPIESYTIGDQRSFQNAKSAQNAGGELEARLSLGRIAPVLQPISLGANLTYVWSQIEISNDVKTTNTSKKRPLSGQSPYVANLSLGVSDPVSGSSLFLYYNVYGSRIDQVGANGLPDQYEQAFHSVDVIGNYNINRNWALRLTAKNLAFQDVRIKEGPLMRERFNPGTVATISASYTY